jgi:type IV pilus assembly protein PilE
LQVSGDERMARRDWRQEPTVARIVKSFTIGAMVAARVQKLAGRRAIGGFTLIELMAVVVIVAILAAIAYPAFMAQIRKSRRAEAVSMTALIQQAQERWRANQPTYATRLMTAPATDCDTAAEQVTNSCLNIAAAGGARYNYLLSLNTATAYTLTATAIAGTSQAVDSQSGTDCSTLTVTVTNGNGARTPVACWSN